MANTRYLTIQIEDYVRGVLENRFDQPFTKERLTLEPGGHHEFDAVSRDRSIIASIKSASGRTASGKVNRPGESQRAPKPKWTRQSGSRPRSRNGGRTSWCSSDSVLPVSDHRQHMHSGDVEQRISPGTPAHARTTSTVIMSGVSFVRELGRL